MQVIPADSAETLTETLTTFVTQNAGVIVAVIAIGVGVAFVVRWFHKGTRRIKA